MPEIAKFAAGLVPGRLDHVRSQLEQYERRDPALVALAAAASLARLIEPELLRALRLGLDSMISGVRLTVATESAVWFSSLVESRGPEAITFLPAALQVLRSRLAAEGELLEQARAIIEKCHRAAPDVLRWEERMIYFSLTGQDRLLEAEVFRGVRSISSGTRLALVNWITDMWVRLPPQARANVQVARLTQAAEGLTFRRLPASTGATMSGNEVTLEFSRIPTREMGMAVRNGRMFFGNLAIADHGIEVPDFNPVEVEILALDGTVLQTVVVPPDGFIGIPVSNDLVRLRTAAGRIYHVNPGALKPRDGYKTVALFRSKRSARLVHRVAVALMEAAYDCQVFASELPRSSFNTQVYKSSDILVVFFDRRNHDEMDLILRDIRLYAMEDKRQPFLLLATIGTEAPLRYRPPGAVVVELGSKSPAQAAAQILASLPLDESEAQTIPNNLPPLDFFIGRETEIEQILRSVGPDSSTWGVMVAGPAGIGKTALAIRAAQDCPPGWFERIIFVNAVEGYLAGLERSVGLAEIENLSALERRERLRHLLRTKRILFIIDDPDFLSIEGLQDLMEFLDQVGPTGCKAIVTTRRPLRLPCGRDRA